MPSTGILALGRVLPNYSHMNPTVKPLIGCTLCMMLLASCGDEKSGDESSSKKSTRETVTTSAEPATPVKAPEETSEDAPEKSTTDAEDATTPESSTEPVTPPAEEEAPAEEENAPAPENPPAAQAKPPAPQPSGNPNSDPLSGEALEIVTRARGGEAPAQSRLGIMYENGQAAQAFEYLTQNANLVNSWALQNNDVELLQESQRLVLQKKVLQEEGMVSNLRKQWRASSYQSRGNQKSPIPYQSTYKIDEQYGQELDQLVEKQVQELKVEEAPKIDLRQQAAPPEPTPGF